jgi:two-component system, cell cycle sensor histidine kinase and response regulator CckA
MLSDSGASGRPQRSCNGHCSCSGCGVPTLVDAAAQVRTTAEKPIDSSLATHALADTLPAVLWTMGPGGRTIAVGPSVREVSGFSSEEVRIATADFWVERMHPDDRRRAHRALAGLRAGKETFDGEYRWQRRDGSWIWARVRAVLRPGTEGVVDGVLLDVSSTKLLEEQVRHLQKIEAIGEFTAGIAHDFNNLLGVILANDSFLLEALPEGDVRRIDAQAIYEAAERAVALTQQLLSFSRPQPSAPAVVDLNALVLSAESMLRRVIGEDIDLALGLDPTACAVVADTTQIEQILMNLVVNARDAMPDGGKMAIETARLDLNGEFVATCVPRLHGPFVMLAVSDTGCGMDSATKLRVFDPFFTTKADGRGTGLGLSTCRGIVKQMGGHICVDSEPGHGSVFKVYLPRADRSLIAAVSEGRFCADDIAGTETILVVEDDDNVRAVVDRILQRLGYRVLDASHGQEALAIAYSYDGTIDLVLSDVVLPDLGGPEIVDRVRARSSKTRELFMSGHTNDALLRDRVLRSEANFIQKPFRPEALAHKVREVLDA